MKKNILIVTKDKGGFQVAVPVVNFLRFKYNLTVVADPAGVTFNLWEQVGFDTVGIDVLPIDVDLVISTLGAPIALEDKLSQQANARNIPLVFIEDIWGAYIRATATPNYVFTLDEYGAQLVRDRSDKVYAYGSPAFDGLSRYNTLNHLDVRRELDLPVNGKIVLLAAPGQPDEMINIIIRTVQAVKESDVYFIPQLHPKLEKVSPDVYDLCVYLFNLLGEKVIWRNEANMQDLIFASDVVFSTYSTALVESCYLRRKIISFGDQIHLNSMKKYLGIDEFPPIALHCGIQVFDEQELRDEFFKSNSLYVGNQKKYFNSDGKNAERIANQILKILG